jgi:hypothetical protein
MKEFLTFLVKNLVDHPDDVFVEEKTDSTGYISLELKVNPTDIGFVIGKGGKVIKSLRNIVKVKAIVEHKRVNIVLIEN